MSKPPCPLISPAADRRQHVHTSGERPRQRTNHPTWLRCARPIALGRIDEPCQLGMGDAVVDLGFHPVELGF
jgi:hypothetical protein